MKRLFMGDSITAGEMVGGKSFASLIGGARVAVSGTTIGEYSLYPVDGYSLLSQLRANMALLRDADRVVLEYGINDASAVAVGNATVNQVIVAYRKSIDFIKQNCKARIVLAVFSRSPALLKRYSVLHAKYIYNYMKGAVLVTPESWRDAYEKIMEGIRVISECEGVTLFFMFPTEESLFSSMAEDNIHPNLKAHEIVACRLRKEL